MDRLSLYTSMLFRLRTLLILVAVTAAVAVTTYCTTYCAMPAAEAASDYIMELGARAVYRGACGFTLE